MYARGRRLGCVLQDERTRAISALGVAWCESGVTKERGLLVASNAGNRHASKLRQIGGGNLTDFAARGHNFWQSAFGHPKQLKQVGAPSAGVNVEQLRA